jgi:hypothetical protein
MTTTQTPITTDQLSLRVTDDGADRGIMVGRSRSGKSTLALALIEQFHRDYCLARQRDEMGRVLVIDTKPRWRGEKLVASNGVRRHYKGFVKGDRIPHSVVMTDSDQWNMAFDTRINDRLVIAQRNDLDQATLIRWQVGNIERFLQTQDYKYPSLLYIDEGMDFFGPTGNSLYGNSVQRCFRAGGEKGLVSLIGVQRPRTINLQCLTEANVLYLFAINFDEDMKRLREMGFPNNVPGPKENHKFLYFRDGVVFNRYLKIRKSA